MSSGVGVAQTCFPRSAAFQWAVCPRAADLKSRSALPRMLYLIGGRY